MVRMEEAMEKRLHGIGGWLQFFIIALMVLSPLVAFGQTAGEIEMQESNVPNLLGNPVWQSIKLAIWTFTAIQCGLLFSAGYRLWQDHRWSSVRYTIVILWIANPLLSFLVIIVISIIGHADPFAGPQFAEAIGSSLAGVVGATVWTLYLLRSRRVANTYVKPIAAV